MIFLFLSVETIVPNGRVSHRGWIAIGLISGSLALQFAPLVFGTMVLHAAVQLYRTQFELFGFFIGAFGITCILLGILSGVTLLLPF